MRWSLRVARGRRDGSLSGLGRADVPGYDQGARGRGWPPATTRLDWRIVLVSPTLFQYQDPADRLPGAVREDEFENVQYARASPITHVTCDDAPTLLMHGDADDVVPIQQSTTFEAALKNAGVDVRFIRVPGGGHGENFRFAKDDPRLPDQYGETRRWFDAHLGPAR